jgi:hypothetical protein
LFLGLLDEGFVICICYVALNGMTAEDDEVGRMWKELIVANCNMLIQHLSGGTEENHSPPNNNKGGVL